MTRHVINTTNAPAAIGPYSQAIKLGGLVFTSGQIGLTPAGELVEGLEAQVHQAFTNLGEILKQAGGSFTSVVKCTLFLTDLNDFSKVNEIMQKYVSEPFPARSTVGVVSLPKGALVEVGAIAQGGSQT